MKRAALFPMLFAVLVLAMLMSPAAGQTAITPEVTPEATAEIMPPGFEWVMRSDQQCSLSPDETLLAVAGDGVYQFPELSMQFAFEEYAGQQAAHAYFTADGTQVIVNGDDFFDVVSGKRLDNPEDRAPLWGLATLDYVVITTEGEETWTQTLYDTATGKPAFPPFEHGVPERLLQGLNPVEEIMPAWPGIYHYDDIVLTYDLNTLTANVYDFASQELLYTRIFDGIFTVDPTNTYIAVSGKDIRTLHTNEVVLGDLPVFTPMGEGRTSFSTDGELALVERRGEAFVYSLPDSAELGRLPLGLVWGGFELSEDGQALIVSVWAENSEQTAPAIQYSVDLATHAVEGFDLSTVLIPVGHGIEVFLPSWSFSNDGRYYASQKGIYETASGELVVSLDPIIGNGVLFSDDSSLAARAGDGVYDLAAKRKLYGLANDSVNISPDSRFVWSRRVGVFDARTGELLYPMPVKGYYSFSSSSKYLTTLGYQTCNILALPEVEE